jgi:hypothetical protein
MQNAHLRFGLLEYQRATEKISTRIRVRVDRYVGEDRKAHLLSVFGNDWATRANRSNSNLLQMTTANAFQTTPP